MDDKPVLERTGSIISINGGGSDYKEEQTRNAMMYAARMRYLHETDQIKPDVLFMTRRQAQKLALQHNCSKVFKKIEVSRKAPGPTSSKKSASKNFEGRPQTWIKCFQAGCHFWQSQETGECRTSPPDCVEEIDSEEKEEEADSDITFPPSFRFLDVIIPK